MSHVICFKWLAHSDSISVMLVFVLKNIYSHSSLFLHLCQHLQVIYLQDKCCTLYLMKPVYFSTFYCIVYLDNIYKYIFLIWKHETKKCGVYVCPEWIKGISFHLQGEPDLTHVMWVTSMDWIKLVRQGTTVYLNVPKLHWIKKEHFDSILFEKKLRINIHSKMTTY